MSDVDAAPDGDPAPQTEEGAPSAVPDANLPTRRARGENPTVPVSPLPQPASGSGVFTDTPLPEGSSAPEAKTLVTPRSDMDVDDPGTLVEKPGEPSSDRIAKLTTKQELPARLGRYLLTELLGVGGMAEVYLAEQDGPAGFKKRVVLKRILPHLGRDQRFVEMFLREAQVAAHLNHTNIVQIFELGQLDETYFIAMEYVRGLSLFQLAKRAWSAGISVPLELVIYAVADAARGLHHAHHAKNADGEVTHLIHRDVSPDNLIVNEEGVTKVLDFGIAKASTSESMTKTGELKGKIPFMPPEQIQGWELGHRSDLYSLGVTAYWLLTGVRPFRETNEMVLMQAIVSKTARPIRQLNPQVPVAVEAWVHALLEKDPQARPENGLLVARELAQLVSGDRSEVATFVRSLREQEIVGSGGPSAGFIPASPITTTLGARCHELPEGLKSPISEEDLVPDIDIDGPQTSAGALQAPETTPSNWPRQVAIGAMSAVLTLGLIFALMPGPAEPPLEIAPPVVTQPGGDEPADDRQPGEQQPGEQQPGEQQPDEPGTDAQVATPADDGDTPVNPATDTPTPVTNEPAADEPTETSSPARRRAKARHSARARPRKMKVQLKAPSSVVWKDGRGRTVGRGTTQVTVSTSTKSLHAHNRKTGGDSTVSLSGGAADYGELPTGKVLLRAYPFADVYAGSRKLGTAPMPELSLPVGRYRLTFKHEGKAIKRTVTVRAGRLERVLVKMNE